MAGKLTPNAAVHPPDDPFPRRSAMRAANDDVGLHQEARVSR